MGDPPLAGRARERGLHAVGGRGREGTAHPRGDGAGGQGRQGRGRVGRPVDRRGVDPHGGTADRDGRPDRSAMNIHEYQAKALLRSYRITTPRGEVVYTAKAAARVAEDLGGSRWVVKA